MNDKIKQRIENNQGSSLAFVLIIGMVLMVMVASIITVANSDFTFTQKTVESRQAYIDAKSVIEFGKIEINSRMMALKDIDAATKIDRDTLIGTLANGFTVYGTTDSVTENLIIESLSLSPGPYGGATKKALGVCTVEPPSVAKAQYIFNLETQNLRRKLDYKVDFNYTVTTTTGNWINASYEPIVQPDVSEWLKTNIYTIVGSGSSGDGYGNGRVGIAIEGQKNVEGHKDLTVNASAFSLNIGKDDAGFNWLSYRTLNLTANDIYLRVPLPTTQINGSPFGVPSGGDKKKTEFNMTATNIIFSKGLTIGDNVTVNLTCDNLWVGGDIILGKNSTLTVTGTTGKPKNQMIVNGMIKTKRDNSDNPIADNCEIDISNLAYFQCAGLDIYNSDLLKLESKNIVVNGPVSLTHLDGSNNEIKTQYFDCSGKTTITNTGSSSTPVVFLPDGTILNIRFAGGYDQRYSHVDINGADKVVFGTSFFLEARNFEDWHYRQNQPNWLNWMLDVYRGTFYWDHLYIEGDNIYLEGNPIEMTPSSFIYDYKNSNINIYIQSKIEYLNSDDIEPGSYTGKRWWWRRWWLLWWEDWGCFGRIISSDLDRTGNYPENSSGGTITPGAEVYY